MQKYRDIKGGFLPHATLLSFVCIFLVASSLSHLGPWRVCTAAVSSPERGCSQSIGDPTSRMQPEQCPCCDEHPPDRLRHIAVCCQGTQSWEHSRGHRRQCWPCPELLPPPAVWLFWPLYRLENLDGIAEYGRHRAMWIFKPRCLVNSCPQDSHLCARLSAATSSPVVASTCLVLWTCMALLSLWWRLPWLRPSGTLRQVQCGVPAISTELSPLPTTTPELATSCVLKSLSRPAMNEKGEKMSPGSTPTSHSPHLVVWRTRYLLLWWIRLGWCVSPSR